MINPKLIRFNYASCGLLLFFIGSIKYGFIRGNVKPIIVNKMIH